MSTLFAIGADALIFIALSWAVWRLLGRSLPLAVLPILAGLGLAATGLRSAIPGVPSELGNQAGFSACSCWLSRRGWKCASSPTGRAASPCCSKGSRCLAW